MGSGFPSSRAFARDRYAAARHARDFPAPRRGSRSGSCPLEWFPWRWATLPWSNVLLTSRDGYGLVGTPAAPHLLANASGGPRIRGLVDRCGLARGLTAGALVRRRGCLRPPGPATPDWWCSVGSAPGGPNRPWMRHCEPLGSPVVAGSGGGGVRWWRGEALRVPAPTTTALGEPQVAAVQGGGSRWQAPTRAGRRPS
jgi:hypothetical protein